MKPSPRTPSKLSDSVHHQLNMYALAASAAGVAVLALAQPAEAKIVYTKTHHVIGARGLYKLDLTNDGTVDFQILESGNGGNINRLLVKEGKEASGNAVEGYRGVWLFASALKRGAPISRRQGFINSARWGELMASVFATSLSDYHDYGQWYNVANRYLGLKFQVKGKTHYGWARLNVTVNKLTITATLTGYAYETIAGKAITAGATKGTDEILEEPDASLATPPRGPASLGILALGGPGLSIWRQ